MAGNHGHGAEFAHGARIAQNHAIDQTPFDIGQGDIPEGLPARGSEHDGGLLLVTALGLHQRNQFTGDEGEGHEHGGQHDAGHGKDDLDLVLGQPRAQPAIAPKTSTYIRPATTGEMENGRSIKVVKNALPLNSYLAIHHAAATPKTRFKGTAISAVISVSLMEEIASGSPSAVT